MYRELLTLESKAKNILLARERFSTIWGGASLLRMLLRSMTDLLQQTDWQWDFIINLSESDYMIKTMDSLVEFLTANRNRNFVKSHGREVQRFIQKQGLDKTFVECDTHMWRIGDRELPFGIQIDGGSDWIALSRPFVQYVTATGDNRDELIEGLLRIFHHTLLPAESFFHTALRNSEFCNTYVDNNLHVTNWKRRLGCKCQYKHVVDWCGCSPNVFKAEDWQRLMATQGKELYFARKFEPIVNQAIILRLEEWLIGPYPVDYPNLHRYWQSMYNSKDKSPKADEAIITVASSLAHLNLNEDYLMNALFEVTAFMHLDVYKGFLIHHEIVHEDDDTVRHQLELWARPQQFGQVSRASILGKRIKNIEVSTEYDPKEQLVRNFAKIMGPYSEPTFVLHLSAVTADMNIVTASNYNLTVLWINPAGYLNDVTDILVESSITSPTVSVVKSNLKMPLLPGIWTAKLVSREIVVGQCNFVIIPKISSYANISIHTHWWHLNQAISGKYKKEWEIFLPDPQAVEHLEETALINAKLVGDEQIVWINKMIRKFFLIKDVCTLSKTNEFPDLLQCNETSWSSFAPDPKSELF